MPTEIYTLSLRRSSDLRDAVRRLGVDVDRVGRAGDRSAARAAEVHVAAQRVWWQIGFDRDRPHLRGGRAFHGVGAADADLRGRSEEHTSELQSQFHLVCPPRSTLFPYDALPISETPYVVSASM